MTENKNDVSRAAFDFVDEIERMSDRQSVMDRFSQELSRYGFHAWLITGLPNPGDRIDPLMLLNGWPEGWTELYTKLDLIQNDPIAAHCYRSIAPFEWAEAPYDPFTNPKGREVMERAIDFRMNQGFCVPIHSGNVFQAAVSVAGERIEIDKQVKRALHLMSLYVHSKAAELFAPKGIQTRRLLTQREREVLQWTAAGKTSWEISQILGVAESTVTTHIKAAAVKLDTTNRVATIVMALRRGEISL